MALRQVRERIIIMILILSVGEIKSKIAIRIFASSTSPAVLSR